MVRRLAVAALLQGVAACAGDEVRTDRDALVRVTRQARADGRVQLRVEPTRADLQLNAKSPPRYVAGDGTETPLTGTLDAAGEKFVGRVAVVVPRSAGMLLASVCDAAVGICRKAVVPFDA